MDIVFDEVDSQMLDVTIQLTTNETLASKQILYC